MSLHVQIGKIGQRSSSSDLVEHNWVWVESPSLRLHAECEIEV